MSKKKWHSWNFKIFFVLIFITIFLSLLKGQEIDTLSIQIDTSLVKLDTNLSLQTQGSLILITDEEIQKEMQFSTREKIGSCVVGGFFGFLIGAGFGASINAALVRPAEDEALAVIPGFLIGGCLGAVIGGKAMYEIVEHSEEKAAKQKLSKRQEDKVHLKNNESNQ